jgi:hypothetical protein
MVAHKMSRLPLVLVSWVAVNNDPYEREGKSGANRLIAGRTVPGPTLTLLFDDESPLVGQVKDVVLLHRRASGSSNGDRETRAVQETVAAINERREEVKIQLEPWSGDDPTDHRSIFEFLREKMPEVRRRFAGRELVIHASPGTPAMHTIWVLMAETGFIEAPFRVVQSYRKQERRGRPAVVPVELGIDTFYKVYKAANPAQVGSDEQRLVWDPARFRTPRMRALFTEARRRALQRSHPALRRTRHREDDARPLDSRPQPIPSRRTRFPLACSGLRTVQPRNNAGRAFRLSQGRVHWGNF